MNLQNKLALLRHLELISMKWELKIIRVVEA